MRGTGVKGKNLWLIRQHFRSWAEIMSPLLPY